MAITLVLLAGYYLLPLERLSSLPIGLTLTAGLLALAAVAAYQVRAVVRARHPAVKAVEALATTAPLFLLLFAAAYFLMAADDPSNFTVETYPYRFAVLHRHYIFTVGFGDIASERSSPCPGHRQMILDLIVLGLGIRILVGAVDVGRQKTSNGPQAPGGG
jgi:hypothetical protein